MSLYFVSVSDSIAEEEFLYHFNLSKCDRPTTTKSKTKTKPLTRSIVKLKVAKHAKISKVESKCIHAF